MAGFGTDNDAKALQFIADGEKCLKKWTLFSSTAKNEDAAECFDKAARSYKVARKMEEAAEAYERAAAQYEVVKSNHEAARAYVEAAKCRKSFKPETAIDAYSKAIGIYNESGRFQQAGKMLTEVGEIHESAGEYESAVNALEQASDYLAGEGSSAQANACLVKVAGIISKEMDPPELGRAAEIYEKLGRSCMEKKLLHMNAKAYWLQAVLCLLALGDTVAARNKEREFLTVDHTFDDSREYRFLDQLILACEEFDIEAFSQHCFDYDQISKLDPWKTNMCLRIKRTIEAGEGADDDDEELDLT